MLINRNITVNGLRTSVRLEPEFWEGLWTIADSEGMTVDQICSAIDDRAGSLSRTAAIRLFIVSYFDQARAATARRVVHEQAATVAPRLYRPNGYVPVAGIAGGR